MGKKLVIEQIRGIFRSVGVAVLDTTSKGINHKYHYSCVCGGAGSILLVDLQKRIKKQKGYILRCNLCRDQNRYKIEWIKGLFKKCGAELVSREYAGLREKLEFRCGCGKLSQVTLENFNRHRQSGGYVLRCFRCVMLCVGERKKLDVGFIKSRFIEYGVEPLFEEYTGNTQYLNFRCKCGEKSEITWLSFKKNGTLRCDVCKDKNRLRGEKHLWYKSDITDIERRIRKERPVEIQEWYRRVIQRFNYRCIISGEKEGDLSAHHIYGFAGNGKLRYELDNGVCISRRLHKLFHDEFGRGKNTYEQFSKFYELQTGMKFDVVCTKDLEWCSSGRDVGFNYFKIKVIQEFWKSVEIGGYVGDQKFDFVFRGGALVVDVLSFSKIGEGQNYWVDRKRMLYTLGYEYLVVFESETGYKKMEIVLNILRNKLGLTKRKICARDTVVKEITHKEATLFIKKYHRQGDVPARVRIGLYFEGELVSVMTLGKSRFGVGHELLRFCSKGGCNVQGGASKLFKYFKGTFVPDRVISYADLRFSSLSEDKTVYSKLGFTLDHISRPNYWYIKGEEIFSRLKFQKHKLNGLLDKFATDLSESENMKLNGYERVFDCGNLVFVG